MTKSAALAATRHLPAQLDRLLIEAAWPMGALSGMGVTVIAGAP